MEKRTIIDEIVFQPQTGQTLIRMHKQIVEGDLVLASEPHRTSVRPDGDIAAQIAAVNTHLATMGFPSVKTEDVAVLGAALAPLASVRATKAAEVEAKNPKK